MLTGEDRKTHQTDPSKIKPGDVMAVVHWVKVQSVSPTGEQMIVNPVEKMGSSITVMGRDLLAAALSADYYAEEITMSMTEVAEKLISSFHCPFTVCFTKQPKKGEEEGEERVLRGRLLGHEALLGRSHVEDLDQPEGERIRLVDHRTIKWLILEGVKFKVGKKRGKKSG